MSRKTFIIAELVKTVNNSLATSICTPDVRQGMMNMLEDVLHKSGNYNGFQYLNKHDVPGGHKPGINTHYEPKATGGSVLMIGKQTYDEAPFEARFANTDRTRVCYFQ